MLKYPMSEIGNKLYDYYVIRYGYFLKSVRFEEYDVIKYLYRLISNGLQDSG